ncbi:shikimate dehydrogenase [uncultured Bilophila sp.]|uniref:shikimate dehydrogenase n=1 Tax=uncultured Bilophila sp. TaxID=529385 RepID=UPI0026DDBAFE|nr:shikimate dehydrogenase [uncultured Bilophila sp.]
MSAFTPPALHGIIGYPLGHSLSPLMHNTAFRTLGLPGVYLSWPVEPGRLPAFMDAVRLLDIRGCSITIPHKVDVLPLLDAMTDGVREMGACNTLYRDGEKICGENTDVIGFMAPLRAHRLSPETRVLLLGAGGVSRAAVAGLRRLGLTDIAVTNRRRERAEALAEEFGLSSIPWEARGDVRADLVINTTSLGMTGAQERETPYPSEGFRGTGIAYDLVYTPFRTRFLHEAEAAGWNTLSGLDMFIAQGDAQFRLWTGRRLPPEAVEAVKAALYGTGQAR